VQFSLATAFAFEGEQSGMNESLAEAIVLYRKVLEASTRERVPIQWATTQNNLGVALTNLGGREGGTETLQQAVDAFREALEERTRERVPLDWAMTQNNLGTALGTLGERESGTEAHQGGRRLSRGAEGKDPRARAARLGDDPEQSRQCA
jgi:tetratricopeptide (TPR) repeat protein